MKKKTAWKEAKVTGYERASGDAENFKWKHVMNHRPPGCFYSTKKKCLDDAILWLYFFFRTADDLNGLF